MKLILDNNSAHFKITAYEVGMIRINDEELTQSCVLNSEILIRDWGIETIDQLTLESLAPVIERKPEIFILGTGRQLRFPKPQFQVELAKHGIALEVMDTGAACRTYEVLSAENRDVMAALMVIR